MKTVEFKYGKWETPENSITAFEAVRDGLWNLPRFDKWVKKIEAEAYRDGVAEFKVR